MCYFNHQEFHLIIAEVFSNSQQTTFSGVEFLSPVWGISQLGDLTVGDIGSFGSFDLNIVVEIKVTIGHKLSRLVAILPY